MGGLVEGLLGAVTEARAETPPTAAPTAMATESVRPIPTSTTRSPLIQRRGRRREQKETEGTEAPGRFEADTILKSPYSVGGQPLEVDPD
ncbi:MAG: hypothetical protein JST04_05555 [Bdellovibrionales bacterium]|nr:hypothetical protein [Bdellovibrionales bacterium]